MTHLKELSVEEKRMFGPALNELKTVADQAITQAKETIVQQQREQALRKQEHFDVTAYKPKGFQGSLHIYSTVTQTIEDIFISMGFEIAEGPELESDYYNFEALNIPSDHPARDMYDTFWMTNPGLLLRTHTSPVQIREMEKKGAPLAIVSPGRVFRHESVDASHHFMFRQYEGFLVGKDISVSNLLATAQAFFQAFFEKDKLDIRVRPGYFPFVEPGLEIDAACPFCTSGCNVCKGTRWIEMLGSGLIHPNVLRSGGIDPEIYSGFAFGGGTERLAMLKYGINDIRLFTSSNVEFLKQF